LTLGRSNEQIACLVISLFPFFPANANDNRYHLQALRQLYAMAAEPRSLVTIDANSGLPVFVPVKVTTTLITKPSSSSLDGSYFNKAKEVRWNRGGGGGGGSEGCENAIECTELVAPCLLSIDLKRIIRIQINSDRYHKLDLWPKKYASHARALETLRLIVKRKEGCVPVHAL
jgi:hypothetical protein